MSAKTPTRPDYHSPPVVETVVGVQFERLPAFKNAHLGSFWQRLGSRDWPTVIDVSPLPPQVESFSEAAQWGRGMRLQLTQDPASRLQIKNRDANRMLQLQNNRFHLNWLGEGGDKYPRYSNVQAEFKSYLDELIGFASDHDLGPIRPDQWEVTYVNHIPQGTVWNTPADWKFFSPMNSMPTIEDFAEAESFGGEWHFAIPDQRGRLHVQWQHGLKSHSEDGEREFIRLVLTARGAVEKPGNVAGNVVESVCNGLDLGHDTIVLSFRNLMSDDANKYWGLK